jgi:tRNA (mo5U34)-methyltransferase
MTPEDKRQLRSLSWYHRIELGEGIITPGLPWENLWRRVEEAIRGLDFRGKRVLDIGCWDGKWTFLAESLGAKVTATDCVSQRWGGRDTFLLAAKILGSKATYMPQCDVCKLSDIFKNGSFDIVLFMGVLYHLRYPTLALSQVRRVLDRNGVMVLESHAVKNERTSAIHFNYCEPDVEDKSNWLLPTTLGLRKLVQSSYFQIQREIHIETDLRSPIKKAVRRLMYPNQKEYIRAIIVAKAKEWEDPGYAFPDSFLSDYDPRFKNTDGKADKH